MQLSTINLALTRIFGGSGYGAALNLDFTSGNQTLDPRITFTRASNATATGPDGTIQYAPHNLLTYSEQFDDAAWGKSFSSVGANVISSPDGTITSDSHTETSDASAQYHSITRTGVSVTPGAVHTLSIYVKAGSRSYYEISPTSGAGVNFNLGTGSINFSYGTGVTGSITSTGNGWYRLSVSAVISSSTTNIILLPGGSNGATNYIGNGSVSAYIWGAQLNVGALQPYYPTTVKNLLGYTQEFDNAAWTKSNATVTANATTAPDGTMSAQKLVENTATASHRVDFANAPISAGTQTLSIYLNAAERSAAQYQIDGTVGGVSSGVGVSVNLTTGAVTPNPSSGNLSLVSASTLSVGGGWYRLFVTFTSTATATGTVRAYIQNPIGTTNYTGDGTSGIYIWGAQLSDSASLDPYVYNPGAAPSASAYYGPRFDYDPVTLAPKGLLIEEQRTNLLQQSENLSISPWSTGGASCVVTANDGVAPNGTQTATKLDSAAGSGRFNSSAGTLANATAYTTSIFVKLVSGGPNISLVVAGQQVFGGTGGDRTVVFNAATGAFVSKSSDVSSYAITDTGNGWWRVSGTFTTTASALTAMAIYAGSSAAVFYTWGAQLEAGSFPTSYIPTTSAQVTRAADVATMTGTNFSSWYNQTEGTLFGEFEVPPALANFPNTVGALSDGTTNNQIVTYAHTSGLYASIRAGGVNQGDPGVVGSPVVGTTAKFAEAYQTNNSVGAWNGVVGTADTSVTLPVVNQFRIGTNGAGSGYINSHLRRIAYFPRRLSNSELQGITS